MCFTTNLSMELHDPNRITWEKPRLKRHVATEIANGMQYLQKKDIIHNRLNPKSILLKYADNDTYHTKPTVLLSDFSVCMVSSNPSLQAEGLFVAMPV